MALLAFPKRAEEMLSEFVLILGAIVPILDTKAILIRLASLFRPELVPARPDLEDRGAGLHP